MKDGQLPPAPRLETIARVSPSRFIALKECALREAFSSNKIPPALPKSPIARLGTATHGLLDDAAAGRLGTAVQALEVRWDELVAEQEAEMSRTWLERQFAPLRESIGSFDERRLLALARAAELAATAAEHGGGEAGADGNRTYGTELWVQASAGEIGGFIDAVLPTGNGPVIRDYKTGAIRHEDASIKPEYAVQLKLYAAMYAADRGVWPSTLELVTLRGESCEIPFSEAECDELLEHALATRARVNALIEAAQDDVAAAQYALASPSAEHCRFCSFRPYCQPYHDAGGSEEGSTPWPGDTWGVVAERRALMNGKGFLRLVLHADERRIRGLTLDTERHPALALLEDGVPAEAFNLRVLEPHSFEERLATVLYARVARP